MKRLAPFLIILLISCNEPQKQEFDPVGTWENSKPWDINAITLEVREDTMMLFRCMRNEDSLSRYILSAGKWQIAEDSFLIMTELSRYWQERPQLLFAKEMALENDSTRVLVLNMQARLLIHNDTLFDVNPDGTRSKEKFYTRVQ
jgi:hypothetical protein